MTSLWRHTLDVCTHFGMYRKRRPIPILWYQLDESWGSVSKSWGQGRSQPHSPGWARVPLSSFFSSNFDQFSPKLYIFSSPFYALRVGESPTRATRKASPMWFCRVGESPTREGPGYATARGGLVNHVTEKGFVRIGLTHMNPTDVIPIFLQLVLGQSRAIALPKLCVICSGTKI